MIHILHFKIHIKIPKNQNKIPETIHLSDLWEHTIAKIFKHDPKSQLGLMIKEWVVFNKLENFNSLLNYPIDDFTPSGNLCYLTLCPPKIENSVYLWALISPPPTGLTSY